MPSIFSKHGVLSGRIDHYCLICAEHFTSEEDTLAHIVDPQHKDNLKSCGYFAKYKKDFIRKAKGVYFCEPCSLTFPTATKVELHVEEPSHIEEKNKNDQWLKRVGGNIIVFDKFIVTEDAWNSFVEDTCFLCNTEFDDSVEHKASRGHILNLIKSEVMLDDVEIAAYRMIDDKSKQCLTCNKIIGNGISTHFKSAEHKESLVIYVPKENNDVSQTKVTNNHVTAKPNDSQNSKNKVKDNKANIDEKKQDINGAKAKKLKDTSKTKSAELDDIYCNNLGAKNYVTSKYGYKWCILCEFILDESPAEHIRGKHHQTLLKLHKTKIANNHNVDKNNEGSNLFECMEKYQNNNINIDLINKTAFCKKCSKDVDFDTDAIEKHIEEHKNTNKKASEPVTLSSGIKSNGSERTTLYTKPVQLNNKQKKSQNNVSSGLQVGEYARKHGLSHNRADNSYYCKLCSRRLPTTLNDLQKHVASSLHKENITNENSKNDESKAPVKLPLFKTIETFEMMENEKEKIVIINKKYWLNAFDFFLIAKKHDTVFCITCHIDLIPDIIMEHIMTSDSHRESVEKSLFITSLEDEFVREIKLEVYHCGYCNCTEEDWDDLLEHLTTSEHNNKKMEAKQRLRDHKSDPSKEVRVKEVERMVRRLMENNYF